VPDKLQKRKKHGNLPFRVFAIRKRRKRQSPHLPRGEEGNNGNGYEQSYCVQKRDLQTCSRQGKRGGVLKPPPWEKEGKKKKYQCVDAPQEKGAFAPDEKEKRKECEPLNNKRKGRKGGGQQCEEEQNVFAKLSIR